MKSPLILASSSPFRKQLLEKLGLPFIGQAPNIDESPHKGETAIALATRLSTQKAEALSLHYPNHLIIGCDQVATLNDQLVGKPGNHPKAMEQLLRAQGESMQFVTALTLLNSATQQRQISHEIFTVKFRPLSYQQIESYLLKEQPYQCAGSFKCEGLGIALFEKLEGRDPNSLVGLPLLLLCEMLIKEGVDVLTFNHPAT